MSQQQQPITVTGILQRLLRRTDLPAEVLATLHTASEIAICAEADHYQMGLDAGIQRGKEMAGAGLQR